MCLILDVNCYGDYLNLNNEDMEPLREFMEHKSKGKSKGRDKGKTKGKYQGRIVYSTTPKLQEEHKRANAGMEKLFEEWRRNGKVEYIDKDIVQKQENKLKPQNLHSDDPHIIALALVANVELLVTQDKYLRKDFREIMKKAGRGPVNIYYKKSHERRLKSNVCIDKERCGNKFAKEIAKKKTFYTMD